MKRKLSLIFVVMMFFVLCGCNSEVYLYYTPTEQGAHYALDIRMDKQDLNALHKGSGAVGNDYYWPELRHYGNSNIKLEAYLITLLKYKTPFVYSGAVETDTDTTYFFETTMPVLQEEDTLSLQTTRTDEMGLFYNYYNFEAESPISSFREEYDKAYSEVDNSSIMSIIVNGWTEIEFVSLTDTDRNNYLQSLGFSPSLDGGRYRYEILMMPSFFEAFPSAKTMNSQLLKFSYFLQTNLKIITGGKMSYDSMGNKYYEFKTVFVEGAKISYQIKRANSPAWNILSIMIGCGTVAFVLWLSKKIKTNKDKPKKTNTILDFANRLPYNPQDDSDPFTGY